MHYLDTAAGVVELDTSVCVHALLQVNILGAVLVTYRVGYERLRVCLLAVKNGKMMEGSFSAPLMNIYFHALGTTWRPHFCWPFVDEFVALYLIGV